MVSFEMLEPHAFLTKMACVRTWVDSGLNAGAALNEHLEPLCIFIQVLALFLRAQVST